MNKTNLLWWRLALYVALTTISIILGIWRTANGIIISALASCGLLCLIILVCIELKYRNNSNNS